MKFQEYQLNNFHICYTFHYRLLPFGGGRCVCPGEALAKNRLFLFWQHFTLLPPDDETKLPTHPRKFEFGLFLTPPNYKLRVLPRQDGMTA